MSHVTNASHGDLPAATDWKVGALAGLIAGIVFLMVFLSAPGYSANGSELTDVVQMPVAVDRAVEAGISEQQLRKVARTLVEQGVGGRDFNDSIRASAEGLSASAQDPGIGNFTVERVREGLRGRELAEAIHYRLNEKGIPAGGWEGEGPPPVAQNFIPQHAKERIRAGGAGRPDQRNQQQAREAQGRRGDPREEVEERRGGPPADVGEQRGRPPESGEEQRRGPRDNAGEEVRKRRGDPREELEERRGGPPAEIREQRGGPPESEEERGENPPEHAGERRRGPPRGAGVRP